MPRKLFEHWRHGPRHLQPLAQGKQTIHPHPDEKDREAAFHLRREPARKNLCHMSASQSMQSAYSTPPLTRNDAWRFMVIFSLLSNNRWEKYNSVTPRLWKVILRPSDVATSSTIDYTRTRDLRTRDLIEVILGYGLIL